MAGGSGRLQAALLLRGQKSAPLGCEAKLTKDVDRLYLERRGVPSSLAELREHTLIGFDHENAFIRSVRAGGFPVERGMFALRSDSDLALLAALRAGFGIGVCQVGLARRSTDLVRVMAKSFLFKLEVWIVMHSDLRSSARCRVVGGGTDRVLRGELSALRSSAASCLNSLTALALELSRWT
jgi:hypothetical protein